MMVDSAHEFEAASRAHCDLLEDILNLLGSKIAEQHLPFWLVMSVIKSAEGYLMHQFHNEMDQMKVLHNMPGGNG